MESKAELEGVISRDIHHDFIAAERAESSEKADSSLHQPLGKKATTGITELERRYEIRA